MIENYLLQYLVSFAKNKTLSKTANELNVSPATVSRGLQKLEKQVGTTLFIRKPQKISFTPAGIHAIKLAKRILQEQEAFVPAIKNFSKREIIVASTTPTPLLLLKEKLAPNPKYIFNSELLSEQNVLTTLFHHQADVIFTTEKVDDAGISCFKISKEQLFIKITKFNPLYKHDSISFSDLNHHEFIVLSNIGNWNQIIKDNIPHGIFIYQKSISAFNELVKKSNFPIFRTNLSIKLKQTKKLQDNKRKLIPIIDPEAYQTIYAVFRKQDSEKIKSFLITAKEILN